jgi:hypothetical protein
MRVSTLGIAAMTAMMVSAAALDDARAGCGCEKAPPALADVRPHMSWPGRDVTIFDSRLVPGETLEVRFSPSSGAPAEMTTAVAVSRRDFADGVAKPQLVVTLPDLPPGPTAIDVRRPGSDTALLALDDRSFTAMAQPLAVPSELGEWTYPQVRAAVDRDGVIYVGLDLAQLEQPLVFRAQAIGVPLRFGNEDVLFYNTQGFLMQALVKSANGGASVEPVPGMFVAAADDPSDSDVLTYSRHEFATYFLQHGERQQHAFDPQDASWHQNGTPHIDHDHLILAIDGRLQGGAALPPGATPAFDLAITTASLFHHGVVGVSEVSMSATSSVDFYDTRKDSFGSGAHVYSNKSVNLAGRAIVDGDAVAPQITVGRTASVRGNRVTNRAPWSFMDVQVPVGIPSLGTVDLGILQKRTIVGPGSFVVSNVRLGLASTLEIDNRRGPVTLYVTGEVRVAGGQIVVRNQDAEQFAIYSTAGGSVKMSGLESAFYGVIYAPGSSVEITSSSDFYGAVVADRLRTDGGARIHYASSLDGVDGGLLTDLLDPVDPLLGVVPCLLGGCSANR